MAYADEGVPLVVLAGKEYGSGSSRDWAAKGTTLLGVRAVIAESFERIHRSNLIGMGVLPLAVPRRRDAPSRCGLTGEEEITVGDLENGEAKSVDGQRPRATAATRSSSRPGCGSTPERGPLLPARRHPPPRRFATCAERPGEQEWRRLGPREAGGLHPHSGASVARGMPTTRPRPGRPAGDESNPPALPAPRCAG